MFRHARQSLVAENREQCLDLLELVEDVLLDSLLWVPLLEQGWSRWTQMPLPTTSSLWLCEHIATHPQTLLQLTVLLGSKPLLQPFFQVNLCRSVKVLGQIWRSPAWSAAGPALHISQASSSARSPEQARNSPGHNILPGMDVL